MYHSLTMHPVTRIYWTAWLWQIQDNASAGRMLLMHGTDAWLAECQSLCIIRTHALHGANSWSVEKTCTVTWLEYASTIGYILEPILSFLIYILLSGIKSFYANQQTSEILVYYWYFLWIQDRSSAHPMKLAASNIEIKLTKAPVEFFYTSLQNWQLFEFIIASWHSIS